MSEAHSSHKDHPINLVCIWLAFLTCKYTHIFSFAKMEPYCRYYFVTCFPRNSISLTFFFQVYFFFCSDGKESACNAGELGSIPGSGRSPRGGHGNPLWYSCLENPMTEEPGGLQAMGRKEWRMTEQVGLYFFLVLTLPKVLQIFLLDCILLDSLRLYEYIMLS